MMTSMAEQVTDLVRTHMPPNTLFTILSDYSLFIFWDGQYKKMKKCIPRYFRGQSAGILSLVSNACLFGLDAKATSMQW